MALQKKIWQKIDKRKRKEKKRKKKVVSYSRVKRD
jgi:hypothetical protein